MRIAVVGGGPGGLYFARLVMREWPDAVVDVFEQNAPAATFGFGVTLGGSGLSEIASIDPELVQRLRSAMLFNSDQNINLNGQSILLQYAMAGGSITRTVLLEILQALALDVGVRLHSDRRIENPDELADYDLVVGADGANSVVRQSRAATFGTVQRTLGNRFAWYGVARAMAPSALVFRSALGGAFIAHYYAYSDTMTTFVAECDEDAWVGGGLQGMTELERKRLTEEVFAEELQGDPLVDNRSLWRPFPATTNARWYDGRCVLVGDALRVAHPSIGSGTRLAMGDGQALFEALRDAPDMDAALPLFVERRQQAREKLASAAVRSFEWYEQVGVAMRQLPLDFTYDFLTRTGRITDERLASYVPAFADLYRRHRSAARQREAADPIATSSAAG